MIWFTKLGTATVVAAIAVVGISGSAWAGKAAATSFNYNVTPGTCEGPFTVPGSSTSRPVQMIGSQTTVGYRGVSQMTLIAVPSYFLEWVGMDIATRAIETGFSASAGTHMIYMDYDGYVDMEVYSPTQVEVCNSTLSTFTADGTVTFIY